ncbi:MAG: hypothetical protein HUU57_02490 [Bdellovibrio sp.]|nr:hypothetical protein [Bdellovibrio sp.]
MITKTQRDAFPWLLPVSFLFVSTLSPAVIAAPKWKKIISGAGSSLQGGFVEFIKDSTWIVPAGVTRVQVMVIGAGGGGRFSTNNGGGGGGGEAVAGGSATTSSGAPGGNNGGLGGTSTVGGGLGGGIAGGGGGASGGVGGVARTGGTGSNSEGAWSSRQAYDSSHGSYYTSEPGEPGRNMMPTGGGPGVVYIWW